MINAKQIKPQVKGKTDKFSWRLYKFIDKHGARMNRVYATTFSPISGFNPSIDPHDLVSQRIIIGYLDDTQTLLGASLQDIVLQDKPQLFAKVYPDTITDITDWFWENYLKTGVCFLEMNHDHHFENGKCTYCGLTTEEIDAKRKDAWARIKSYSEKAAA